MHAKSLQSDAVQPYGQQPTRLLCPQDSLGKNTGVGCHFLFLYIYIYTHTAISYKNFWVRTFQLQINCHFMLSVLIDKLHTP